MPTSIRPTPGCFPGILKVARFGYDGKGQVRVADRDAARVAFRQLKHEPCVLEQMMPLDYEVSVVLARDAAGTVKCFPTAENSHRHGILDVSIVPARTSGCLAGNAEEIAEGIAQKMGYVGTLAVEFFVVRGQFLVNEMAPRPHNSGHYTIDACVTNQFEQQVRALTGLPLGDARAHSAAVMVNLLGDLWFLKDRSTAMSRIGHNCWRCPISSCISMASTTPDPDARWGISRSSAAMRKRFKSRRWRHGA
jgi:5-(carboxyamino)imidazole ribonucleotide synthase